MQTIRLYLAWVTAAGAEVAEAAATYLEELSRRLDPGTTPKWFMQMGFTEDDYEMARTILAITDPR